MSVMKAVVFRGVDDIRLEEVPKPRPKAGEAVIRVTATTICGTDVHIVKGEYPVRKGLILGHEPVGVIEELGEGLDDEYSIGQRVIVGAITPCGQCFYCLNGAHSQCHGALGGWRFGNTINGAWAEYLLVPDARANLAIVPEGSDRRTGPHAARHRIHGYLRSGEWATSGSGTPWPSSRKVRSACARRSAPSCAARRSSSASIRLAERSAMARRFGATLTLDPQECDVVAEIKRLTDGRGVDVAIEALGRQETFEAALRSVRPGGMLSSLGVYSGKLVAPYEALYAGLGDQRIVTTLCPGGKERMRRLMAMVVNNRLDLTPLITHRFSLDQLQDAYDLFSRQRDGVMKVALYPHALPVEETKHKAAVDALC